MVESYGLPSRYSDFSPLGSGGIGTVFKAFDSRIHKEIALKILNNPDPALRASIENEFSILAKLKHPNLIEVYDFGQSDSGHSFFTMDYIDGPHLNRYFQSSESILTSYDILINILEALDYLAKKNIVHGDIKPENILISSNAEPRPILVDFGLSTIAAFNHDKLFGTPRFLAPEIISSRKYSLKSDLYALGNSFIESQLQNETPLSDHITDEYLHSAQESLGQLYKSSGIQYPRNLASFIVGLANPSLALRPDSPSQAILKLSAISKISAADKAILSTEYLVRDDIDEAVDHFIEDTRNETSALLLKGPIGAGKRSLMAKAISKAQLSNYRTLNYIKIQPEAFTIQDIIDVLSINLSKASSKKLSEQHQRLLGKIKKAEDTQDLGNLGVIYSNIVEYIIHLSKEQPVLIAIPTIDIASLDIIRFITHLINEINYLNANIKVILSHATDMPHEPEREQHLAALADSAKVLEVRGFNATEIISLCHVLFDSTLFTGAEIDSILAFTGGLPLYILDYFNYLLSNDIIRLRGRKYYVDHRQISKTYSLPEYGAMVDSITSKMSSDKLHLLQLLSFYKQPLNSSLLDQFVPYNLHEFLEECVCEGLIEMHGDLFHLKSPVMKYHLNQNVTSDISVKLYLTLADYTILADPDNHSLIADHFIRAHEPEKAFPYAIKAYEKYLSNHEYYSAYNILSSINNIFDKSDDIETKIEILEKLSSLEFTLGHYDDSLSNNHKLIEMVTDEVAASKYYIIIGRIERYSKGNTDKAVEYFKLALDIARRNNAVEAESEALFFLGTALRDVSFLESAANIIKDVIPAKYVEILAQAMILYLFSGLTDKCTEVEKELDKFLSSNNPAILSEVYDAKYVHAFFTGDYKLADNMLRKLIGLMDQSFNEVKRTKHINKLGGIHYVQGQFEKQIDTLKDAYHLVSKYPTSMNRVNILSNMALAHYSLANYSSALSLIEEIKSSIDKYQMTDLPTYYYSVGAETFMIFGDLYRKKYLEYSELLKKISLKSKNRISLGHMNIRYGEFSYISMNYDNSVKYFSRALYLFKGANAKDDILEALLKLSLANRFMEEHGKARDYARQAAKIFREINCGYLKPLYSFVIALTECHDNPDSLAPMLEAIATSRAFGTREWTWQIQFQLARLYKQAGDISNSVKYCRESINTLKEITESFDDSEQISSYLQVPLRTQVFDFVKSLRS